jgi:hypothetical protein
MGECIESGGVGNFIHDLKYQKVEVGGRDYCNDVFCNHKG